MMESHEPPSCPWTPNSGLKSFRSAADETVDSHFVDALLKKTVNSPMKLFETSLNPSPQTDFRSPSRPAKRHRAPPSPATAMILHAARVIDGETGFRNSSPGDHLLNDFDSSPRSFMLAGGMGPFSPPSPARTPSRLLFSPKSEPRSMSRAGLGVSPASGMITSYDGLITDAPSTSLEVVGSIWKSSEMDRRKNANSTARRPLLQQTPMGKENFDDPVPLPEQTPTPTHRKPASSSHSKKRVAVVEVSEPRKDRKTYSTAGRPRVRGEYKCGKCGFYPKKSRHDCDDVKAKSAAGICIEQQVQASEAKAAKRARKGRNDNTSPSGTGTMLYGSDEGRSPNGVAPAKLRYE